MCSARVLLHEMRVKVGVKESSKKKLVRSTWAGHLAEMGDVFTWQREDAQKVEMEARKTEIAMALNVTYRKSG